MEPIKELLQQSIDGTLTPSEQERLAQALAASAELQEEERISKEMRHLLSSYSPAYKDGFSGRVMQRLKKESVSLHFDFYRLFRQVAFSGVAAIIVLLFAIYFMDGSLDLDTIMGVKEYSADEALLTYLNF